MKKHTEAQRLPARAVARGVGLDRAQKRQRYPYRSSYVRTRRALELARKFFHPFLEVRLGPDEGLACLGELLSLRAYRMSTPLVDL